LGVTTAPYSPQSSALLPFNGVEGEREKKQWAGWFEFIDERFFELLSIFMFFLNEIKN